MKPETNGAVYSLHPCNMCGKPASWMARTLWSHEWSYVCPMHASMIRQWACWIVDPIPNPK